MRATKQETKVMGRTLLKIIITIIVLLIIGFLILTNLPQANIQSDSASYSITASELYATFEQNEQSANQKYIDQVIEVAGKVIDIQKDKNGSTVFILETGDTVNGVLCTFDKEPPSEIKLNQTVKVKGLCTGKLMDVVLNKCLIVN
jgi:hypothetical protein